MILIMMKIFGKLRDDRGNQSKICANRNASKLNGTVQHLV